MRTATSVLLIAMGMAMSPLHAATPAAPADPPASTVALAPQINAADFAQFDKTLSSDAFGGRQPGTGGAQRTTDWLVEQFKRMIVKSKDGGFVRMEDVATVELAAQSTDASVAFNGEHAIFIGVQATPQGNPLTLVKGVRALFPELERNLPPSMKMKVAYDSTKFIQSSISEVEKTLIEAVGIVVVVIFLFLASFRSVIIPVVTIPLSLIGVCTLMLMFGFSINLLTLLAMVLAIGLVVDDAIVVVENIHRHLEEGKPPVQAAMQGAREIVGPVISMTITLAAVYAPKSKYKVFWSLILAKPDDQRRAERR